MDTASDVEELPYVVWYQCRMCTHLFFDDIEKMFMHFDKKHGAMIDLDELRSIVYKNGLCMGGLSRSPKPMVKSEDGNETETELISPYPNSVDEDEYEFNKFDEVRTNELVLPEPDVNEEEEFDDDNYQQIEGVDVEYEEPSFESTNNESKYLHNMHDDEEQLAEDDFEFNANGNGEDHDTEDHSDAECDDKDTQDFDALRLCQTSNSQEDFNSNSYDEQDQQEEHDNYNEEGDYHEEGELSVSAEQSMNDGDLDDLLYDEDEDLDYDDVGEAGMFPNEGGQPDGLLNYGFSCKFCGKFFTTRRGVESHEQHHRNLGSQLTKRTNEPRLFPCKICKDKSFTSFKDLKLHVKTHTPERIHICKFCFSTFNNTASLTKHLSIHTRENPHKCHCGKTFVSANTLKIHKKIHTGIKPFVCNFYQCGRAFVTKSTLESHLRTHTGEKPYRCSYCPSSFTTSSAKYRHERHVHKVPEPSIE